MRRLDLQFMLGVGVALVSLYPDFSDGLRIVSAIVGGAMIFVSAATWLWRCCRVMFGGENQLRPVSLHATQVVAKPPAANELPLSLSELKTPDYRRYSGLQSQYEFSSDSESKLRIGDPPILLIPTVFASNTSSTCSMSLVFTLVVTDQNGRSHERKSDGKDAFGHVLGTHDLVTKIATRRDVELIKYLLSPLTLKPGDSVHGVIPFVIWEADNGEDEVAKSIINYYASLSLGMDGASATYVLKVEDKVSGKCIELPIPGPGYKGRP